MSEFPAPRDPSPSERLDGEAPVARRPRGAAWASLPGSSAFGSAGGNGRTASAATPESEPMAAAPGAASEAEHAPDPGDGREAATAAEGGSEATTHEPEIERASASAPAVPVARPEIDAAREGERASETEASGVGSAFGEDGPRGEGGAPGEGSDVLLDDDAPAADVAEQAAPDLKAALEAILIVVDEPVNAVTLAQVLERPTHEVETALRELAAEYSGHGRGFDLRDVAGGWRFYTRADCAQLVERFVRDGQQARLTQAALETLAVVAYRQPVSRARVAAVRGVNSDGVMRTLVARGLVEEAGTDPESQAVLYRTSSYFLERLGLKSLDELPELAPFLPDDVENLEETTK